MKTISLVLLMISGSVYSQSSDHELIKTTINNLFDGMRTADSIKLKSSFSPNALMQTITKNGVKNEQISAFVKSVNAAEKGSLDERVVFSNILIDANLATVWTPYEFYYKGQFSHCGVNSFQLVKQNEEWKIQYIIDTRRKDNCKK